jgi:AGZA family xanthine/uracil permease-like MFS transporter
MLEQMFALRARGTTVGTEFLAGATTFMVMAYIIFVNPALLSFAGVPGLAGQGPGFAPTLAATCLVAGVMTALMGLITNYPLAMAPGMGLNAAVAFQLVAGLKLPWPAAMGVITLEGIIITVLVLTGLRTAVMDAIPLALKRAIGVGIGLFILFIGLYSGGLVKQGTGVPVTLGDLTSPAPLVAVVGVVLTTALMALRFQGALLVGIVLTTAVAIGVNALTAGKAFPTPGMAVMPAHIVALPDFSTLGAGVNFTVFTHLGVATAIMTIFAIMLSDFFDTMGTVIGVGGEGGWLDARGQLPRINRVLLVDALGAVGGGIAAASSATSYIESAAGVAVGGRTGLTALVTAGGFFLALFLSPLAAIVPPQATAGALIVVGYLMCGIMREIPFRDFETGFPALATIVAMPLTYSITNGIGTGMLLYAFIKLVRGKTQELSPALLVMTLAFVVYFAEPWLVQLLAL